MPCNRRSALSLTLDPLSFIKTVHPNFRLQLPALTTSGSGLPASENSSSTMSATASSRSAPHATGVAHQHAAGSRRTKARAACRRKAKARSKTLTLRTLPMEIQLNILEACLVTSNPFIELITSSCFSQPYHELRGHKDIVLGILRTCRLYWVEGSKMFWQRNRFLFSSPTLCPAFIDKLSFHSRLLPWIKHLTLRYAILDSLSDVLNAAVNAIDRVRQMPLLESVEVELVTRWEYRWSNDPSCTLLIRALRRVRRVFEDYHHDREARIGNIETQVQSITVAEVLVDPLGLVVVQLLSTLLKDGGRMGVKAKG